MVVLGRPHEHADRRRGLGVGRGVMVKRVGAVDPEQRRDG